MRPRIRTIKPEIWADEKVGDLSMGARLLFIGLITMADDEGRLRELPFAILGHTFPHDAVSPGKLERWLQELDAAGLIVRYDVLPKRYLAIRGWARHQKVDRPNESELPPPPFDDPSPNDSTKGSRTDPDPDHDQSLSPRVGADPIRSDPDPALEDLRVVKLCCRLADHIRRNDPKAAPDPRSRRWLTDMRLLLVDRNWDVPQVERIIDWSQQDSFWRSNILSPGKLRKQFTQLLLKADAKPPNVVPMRSGFQDEGDLEQRRRNLERAEAKRKADLVRLGIVPEDAA